MPDRLVWVFQKLISWHVLYIKTRVFISLFFFYNSEWSLLTNNTLFCSHLHLHIMLLKGHKQVHLPYSSYNRLSLNSFLLLNKILACHVTKKLITVHASVTSWMSYYKNHWAGIELDLSQSWQPLPSRTFLWIFISLAPLMRNLWEVLFPQRIYVLLCSFCMLTFITEVHCSIMHKPIFYFFLLSCICTQANNNNEFRHLKLAYIFCWFL